MTDSTLTPPAADMMSFLSTTPEHKDSEYETPVHTSQRTELNVIVEDGPDSKLRLAEISAAANPLLAAARPLLCALAAMPAKLDAALVEPYRNLLVVTIALLLMLLVLWLVNWSMSIIGISVLCLAIGFVTPLLALGDVHPFAPLWVRLTLIGFILLMYALYGLYRLWRALRMDEQLLRRFLHPRGEEVPVAGEIKADLRTVNHIVTQAIRQLRQLRVDMPGWRKIFEGKRFLYELPWFMVVGSPGDGKTTALLNTGLQFPLAEQMEQTSRILTVPGGGTLHCDWWFKGLVHKSLQTRLYSNDQTKSVDVKLLNAPQLINVLDPTKTIDMEVTLGGRSLTTTNSVLEAKTLFPDGKTGDASTLLNLDIGQKAGAALQNLPAGEYSGLVSLVISQAVTAG